MHNQIAARDFSRKTLNALTRKGVALFGTTFVPGADGSFANGERAYLMDDNGCHRIRSHAEVRAMAAV